MYNFVLDNFSGNEIPRTYQSAVQFSSSANGASILTGPAYQQKFQWVVSTLVPKDRAVDFQDMFEDWDLDRSNGYPVALGVEDRTFGNIITTSALFATPPTFSYTSPVLALVSFGLVEV